MSKGPTGLGVEFKAVKRTNVKISKKDWCIFEGDCYEEYNVKHLCQHCIWKQKFDIPVILEDTKNGNKL